MSIAKFAQVINKANPQYSDNFVGGINIPDAQASANAFKLPSDQRNKVLATLLAEGQAEGPQGMNAIMNVIRNRVGTPNIHGTGNRQNAFDVVSELHQFSGFSQDNPIFTKYRDYLKGKQVELTPLEQQNLQQAKDIYIQAATGLLPDITKGANQYYNPQKASPDWANKMQQTAQIGNHIFGTLTK